MGSVRRDDAGHDCPCAPSIRGAIDLCEALIDASFASAKMRAKSRKTKRGKGTKIMAVADRSGLPVSVCAESATPHEVTNRIASACYFFRRYTA
jgi:hypothetical protein